MFALHGQILCWPYTTEGMAVSFNHAYKIKGEPRTGKGSFRRPTTGCLYSWEKRKHSCPGVPNDINERTLYLAKKGKSRLKNIVSGFENLLYAFIGIQ